MMKMECLYTVQVLLYFYDQKLNFLLFTMFGHSDLIFFLFFFFFFLRFSHILIFHSAYPTSSPIDKWGIDCFTECQ